MSSRAARVRGHAGVRRMLSPLRVPNFRLYFVGQSISLVGTWMQSVALAWLVLELSGSGALLGLVVATQFLPVLLLGPYGGLVVDRHDKRRLLLTTQTVLAALALMLGLLTVTGLVELWMLFAFALSLGTVLAIDNPTRQAFVIEMVGPQRLQSAVSLNSSMVNVARAVGPAVGGVLIATVGTGVCFLVNAASFGAVLLSLALLRVDALAPATPVPREKGQLREGLHYVRDTVGLLVPLLMMALVGTLAYEFQVVLPQLARVTLHGGAEDFGLLTSAMGTGAVAGGIFVASRATTGLLPLTLAAAAFGAAILGAAIAPSLPAELALLLLVGAGSTAFLATGNSTLQLTSDSRFRGRVMALWTVTFLGSTPIGGPIVGAVAEYVSPRVALALGGVACLVAAGIGASILRRLPSSQRVVRQEPPAGLSELQHAPGT